MESVMETAVPVVEILSKKVSKKRISRLSNGEVSLYEEFAVSGERFSSDEEGEEAAKGELNGAGGEKSKRKPRKGTPVKVNVLTEENAMIVDGLNISDLSDNELFNKLNEFGVDVGPIVDSTRNIYRKKLAILMRGESNFNNSLSPTKMENGGGAPVAASPALNGKEEFSADEEALELSEEIDDEEPIVVESIPETIIRKISRRSNASSVVKKVSRAATPRIINSPTAAASPNNHLSDNIAKTRISNSSNIRPDRFTPTPRRSIHSYRGNEDEASLRYRYKASQNASALSPEEASNDLLDSPSAATSPQVSTCSKILRILPYIFLFLVILASALYVYQVKA
eukprot:TRINITY_DN136_c0_g1_i2.p1 TRINITY_DN136_c0_g1~~TRINITY_DN136_c0_g1_i2.p1  ORF type:complete len:341 (+),score=122.47 TRINITY_DN136_c0_g1_i2:102-1124(+)